MPPRQPNFPGQLDGYKSYFGRTGYVEPPFETYRRKGFEYLEELEQDTHLRGQLEFRFRAAVNPGWQIDPADNSKQDIEIADFVRWNFEELEDTLPTALQKIWQAVPRGFSLSEPVFEKTDGGKYPNSFRLKKIRRIPEKFVRFDFDPQGNVKPDGVVLYTNPAKRQLDEGIKNGARYSFQDFIHATHGATDNPYGDGVTLRCAFNVWVKREVHKFWAYYAETFGAPVAKVKLGQTTAAKTDTNSDEQMARNILRDLRSFSGVVLPKGFELEFIEAMRSGDPTYSSLMQFCNQEISKQIIGSTLATEAGAKNSGASYALGAQHGEVSHTVSYTDALWLEYIVNTRIIRRLVRFNYNTDSFPKFRLLEDNFKDMIAFAQSLPALLSAGFNIPANWAHQRIGIPEPAAGEKVLSIPQSLGQTPASPKEPSAKPDNQLRSAAPAPEFSQAEPASQAVFQTDPVSGFEDPYAAMLATDKLATAALFAWLRELSAKYVKQAEALADGESAPDPTAPAPPVNPGPLKRAFMSAALVYYLLGKRTDSRTIATGEPGRPSFSPNQKLTLPVAFRPKNEPEKAFRLATALENLSKGVPVAQAELEALSAAYEAQFHEIAGLLKQDMETIWTKQLSAFQNGWDLRKFEQALQSDIVRYAGPAFGNPALQGSPLVKGHAELIYRNGMNKAYSEGQDELAQDPMVEPFLWGYEYMAILDDRVRPDHQECDGICLPKEHEFWLTRTGPWDHNCRCTRKPILHMDIEDGKFTPTPETSLPPYSDLPQSGFTRI